MPVAEGPQSKQPGSTVVVHDALFRGTPWDGLRPPVKTADPLTRKPLISELPQRQLQAGGVAVRGVVPQQHQRSAALLFQPVKDPGEKLQVLVSMGRNEELVDPRHHQLTQPAGIQQALSFPDDGCQQKQSGLPGSTSRFLPAMISLNRSR